MFDRKQHVFKKNVIGEGGLDPVKIHPDSLCISYFIEENVSIKRMIYL